MTDSTDTKDQIGSDQGVVSLAVDSIEFLFATTAEDVAKQYRIEAEKSLDSLIDWLGEVKREIAKHDRGAFPMGWVNTAYERLINFHNDIARSNGAVLVRGKYPPSD